MKTGMVKACIFVLSASFFLTLSNMAIGSRGLHAQDILGPQSRQATGTKKVLVVAVRFPDAQPSIPLERVRQKSINGLAAYVKEQSYGQAAVAADFKGYVTLPDSLNAYSVSPYNYGVDRKRVRKLIEDTMSVLPKDVNFTHYDHMLIVAAVHTLPGKGYGMICYCANPGMLSGVRNPRFETLKARDGREFRGGIFVGAENAHLGMYVHDYLHALGGLRDDKRLVPCLYDFDRQSDSFAGMPSFDHHAVYMGPWDVMSQHFIERMEPPPGLSSFTRIRLGWIQPNKVLIASPGTTSQAVLSPLSGSGDLLVIKIPLSDGGYYLIENRQQIGFDRMLPDSGILILKVDPKAPEGHGTVKIMNADPSTGKFAKAVYRLEESNRNIFVDKKNNVAVIPLWNQGTDLGVLITTAGRSSAALRAATAIQNLMKSRSTREAGEKERIIAEAVSAFSESNFEKSISIAAQGH